MTSQEEPSLPEAHSGGSEVSMLQVVRHAHARAFLERAEAWLLESEMENAIALGSARQARQDDSGYQKPTYWATIEDDGHIVGYAFRTPPFRLGLTELPEEALAKLAADVAEVYATLSGVSGPERTAARFAAAWTQPRGLAADVNLSQRLYALSGPPIRPLRPPNGHLRLATPRDAWTARGWGAAFLAETQLRHVDIGIFGQLIEAQQLYIWDDGRARCMAAPIRRVAHGAAIGVLYTPRDARGRGYARATLAAVADALRERGLRDCFLYADPANTAAETVAGSVGFVLVRDFLDIDFGPGSR